MRAVRLCHCHVYSVVSELEEERMTNREEVYLSNQLRSKMCVEL